MSETFDVSKQRYYVYILLKNRLTEHSIGRVTSTRLRRQFKLIHYEYFINEDDAKARETFLKSGFGRDQLKKSLQKTLSTLQK